MTTIGLDYGHGSNTFPPGKGVYKGGKGYAEHNFNAKLGLEIKKLLQHNGFDVLEGQGAYKKEVPLTTRTNLYNRNKVDIVLSLHANAGNSSASGRCAFYWSTSSKGKRLAQYVVNEIKNAGYSTHGNGLHPGELGSWTNMHITRETNMPAVLVEHGFMTNAKDFELIFGSKQKQYIQDMATANVKAICKYFGKTFKNIGGLTMPQYNELKKENDALRKELNVIKNVLNKKADKPSDTQTPSPSHKDTWKWAEKEGLMNGKNPLHPLTREQFATVERRKYNK